MILKSSYYLFYCIYADLKIKGDFFFLLYYIENYKTKYCNDILLVIKKE